MASQLPPPDPWSPYPGGHDHTCGDERAEARKSGNDVNYVKDWSGGGEVVAALRPCGREMTWHWVPTSDLLWDTNLCSNSAPGAIAILQLLGV